MKVNLENTHSPCAMCYFHSGRYDSESDRCQRCDYNISVHLLRNVLEMSEDCDIDWQELFRKHYIGDLWK